MKATYKLNAKVVNPPHALQIAAQIGILNFENPAMKNFEDKDAIVVLAFGTTCKETREKTIGATVVAIQNAYKNTKIVTTLIPGIEYKYNVMLFHEYKSQFKKMTLATPLMYWQGQKNHPDDIAEVVSVLDFPQQNKGTAILLMAHGTPDPSNAYNSVVQEKIFSLGRKDICIYTVEGYPVLEDWIEKLKSKSIKKIILMPLMLVAGVHVLRDMSSENENSHKSILERAGFEVETILKGLGENKKIRETYVKRTNDAWKVLTN